MRNTKIKLLLAVVLGASWTTPSFAAKDAPIFFEFKNFTFKDMVVRMNSLEDHGLSAVTIREFKKEQRCNRIENYWYNIFLPDLTPVSIGHVDFTTGDGTSGSNDCNNKVIDIIDCANINENYTVTCTSNGTRRVTIQVQRAN